MNDIQVAYEQLPFGGSKQSGFGKEHGTEALEGYLDEKWWCSGRARTAGLRRGVP